MARHCIVGAGPAGLAAARAFKREDIEFDAYERLPGVGGIWDFANLDSPIYANTHFISSAKMSGFDGYPMPADYPDYPRHDQVLSYLQRFARDFGLLEHIRFHTCVQAVRPLTNGVEVHLDDGQCMPYESVVVATGHNWNPRIPSPPGEFSGEEMHSRRYRSPEQFAGRRVLVVGGGNSACDIACDVTTGADRVMLSLRRGYHFLPKHIFGVPTDEFAQTGHASGAAFSMLLTMMSAKLARHGVPRPDHGPFDANPVVNTSIIENILGGVITIKPDVKRLCGAEVCFSDGSTEPVDAVIYATGYRFTTPLIASGSRIDGDLADGSDVDGRAMFLNIFYPQRSDVAVMGMFETDGGAFPIFSRQADLIARVTAIRERSPARAKQFAQLTRAPTPDLSGGRHYIDSERHRISVDRGVYMQELQATLQLLS
jgi:hypothetical protein